MIQIKISKELIEEGLITGNIHKFKIQKGIPEGCKLKLVRFDGEVLDLFFSDPPEEVKVETIIVERIN